MIDLKDESLPLRLFPSSSWFTRNIRHGGRVQSTKLKANHVTLVSSCVRKSTVCFFMSESD